MLIENIKSYLYDQNPWWIKSNYAVEEASLPRRELFNQIMKQLSSRQIISINGLRRTGKTTILKQMTAVFLQDKKTSAKNIFFFSFDQNLVGRKTEMLDRILTVYIEEILGLKLWEMKHRVYVLLDEIQYVPDWQAIIKRFYDQSKMIKFIVSGSASLFIREKSKESLAGRIFSFTLPILSFQEYLLIRDIDILLPKADPVNSTFDFKKIAETLSAYSRKISGLFEDYLLKGQFPEIAAQADMEPAQVKQYLVDSILGKILEFDIPIYFNIKRVDEIRSIFNVVAAETGSLMEYDTIARDVGISRNTVTEYFSMLERSYLINMIFNYTRSVRKGLRTAKKGYVASTNFSAALANVTPAAMQFGQLIGHYVETNSVNSIINKHPHVYFIKRREKEIDLLIKEPRCLIPIEVKYTGRIRPEDYANLTFFMNQFQCRRGFVFTKNIAEVKKVAEGEIIFLPVWTI